MEQDGKSLKQKASNFMRSRKHMSIGSTDSQDMEDQSNSPTIKGLLSPRRRSNSIQSSKSHQTNIAPPRMGHSSKTSMSGSMSLPHISKLNDSRRSMDSAQLKSSFKDSNDSISRSRDYSLPEITSVKSKLDTYQVNDSVSGSKGEIGQIETPISPNSIPINQSRDDVFNEGSISNTESKLSKLSDNNSSEDAKEYGLFSSILSVAHNAANMISSAPGEHSVFASDEHHKSHDSVHDHNKSTFSKKLDYLLSSNKAKTNKNIEEMAQELEKNTVLNEPIINNDTEKHDFNDIHSGNGEKLNTSNVQFQSVKDSHINTLGSGNLSLNALGFGTSNEDLPLRKNSIGGPPSRPKPTALSPLQARETSSNLTNDVPSPSAAKTSLANLNVMLDPPTPQRRGASPSVVSRYSTTRLNDSSRKSSSRRSGSLSRDPRSVERDNSSDEFEIGNGKRDNGFASEKRNAEFHQIFRSIPPEDRLIEDYSCALSKDILVQGRMYLSEHYVCFNSNILGWVTNLVIPLKEIVQMEKKSTAVLFPNGMIIRTLHSRYVFATFLQRDSTFDSITSTWNKVILGSKSGSAVLLANGIGKKRKRLSGSQVPTEVDSDSDNGESFASDRVTIQTNNEQSGESEDEEDEEDTDMVKDDEEETPSDITEKETQNADENPERRISNGIDNKPGPFDVGNPYGKLLTGPPTHAPTAHGYTKGPTDTLILEDTINAPLGVVYNLLFGEDGSYMKQILVKQKNFDINELTGMTPTQKERKYTYIKPLGGPIGPKQTKCLITDTIDSCDFNDKVVITQSSNTPDVPSGSSFTVVTKIILTWGKANDTNIYVVTSVVWTSKSWIKGAVERGTVDGQKESMKILVSEANTIIKNKVSSGAGGVGGKKRKKRKSTVTRREIKTQYSDENIKPVVEENTYANQFKNIIDMVPLPVDTFFKLPLLLFLFYLLTWMISRRGNGIKRTSIGKLEINGLEYTLIPSMSSIPKQENLKIDGETEIWEWILNRSGEGNKIQENVSEWDNFFDKKFTKSIKGYKRQEAQEKIRLMQERINEMNTLFEGEKN